MPTIPFRDQQVELTSSVEDLDLDAAEVIEEELGLDLRDIGRLPKIRMMKTLALVSVRRVFPDATMAEVGKISLGELTRALAAGEEPAPSGRVVDFTGTVVLGVAAGEGQAAPVPEMAADGPAGGEVLSPSSAGSEQPPAAPPATEA